MITRIAIVGTSGIGKAHIRELSKKKVNEIYLVGKKYNPYRVENANINNKKIKIINCRNITEIKKKKFKLISICSPTENHISHIRYLLKNCRLLLVEKPFIWKKSKSSNINLISDKLLNKNKNIVVNFPMISLANFLKKKFFDSKKIDKIVFKYHTTGSNKHSAIPVDLLPHAISFFITLTKAKINNHKILRIYKSKNFWKCKIILNQTKCTFDFLQNPKKITSSLSFVINKSKFERKQIKTKNDYINYLLIDKNKRIYLQNPMSNYIGKVYRNYNNKSFIKKNNDIIRQTVYFSEKLV